jgi:hypothetical protein
MKIKMIPQVYFNRFFEEEEEEEEEEDDYFPRNLTVEKKTHL